MTFFVKLGTIIRGSMPERMAFLFSMTDTDGNGSLSAAEVEDFLQDFRELLCEMAQEVATCELEFLTDAERGRTGRAEARIENSAHKTKEYLNSIQRELDSGVSKSSPSHSHSHSP